MSAEKKGDAFELRRDEESVLTASIDGPLDREVMGELTAALKAALQEEPAKAILLDVRDMSVDSSADADWWQLADEFFGLDVPTPIIYLASKEMTHVVRAHCERMWPLGMVRLVCSQPYVAFNAAVCLESRIKTGIWAPSSSKDRGPHQSFGSGQVPAQQTVP